MRSNKIILFLLVLALATGCGRGSGGGTISGNGTGTISTNGTNTKVGSSGSVADNVLPITVNGSLCSANSYLNKPCVSVTVCAPGSSTCQTINDILLDTGSFGLRIFKQALTVPLVQATSGSGSIAECIQFGDGSSLWGPVQTASLILGNEPSVQVQVQVVDSTFGTRPAACANASAAPTDGGFNGILGVGLFAEDCGKACVNNANIGVYYSCIGTSCVGTTVALADQVKNPVTLLPKDNNGIVVQLPSVPAGGSSSIDGSLVLGINTQTNNAPSGVLTYVPDQFGEIITDISGTSYSSIIDSGSNGLSFTPPSASVLPNCPAPNPGWFCPASTIVFTATNRSASGSPSAPVSFQIGNFNSLVSSSNSVFAEIGGPLPRLFDWGLPFYFGRSVYVGIEGKSSSLGNGPYWAY